MSPILDARKKIVSRQVPLRMFAVLLTVACRLHDLIPLSQSESFVSTKTPARATASPALAPTFGGCKDGAKIPQRHQSLQQKSICWALPRAVARWCTTLSKRTFLRGKGEKNFANTTFRSISFKKINGAEETLRNFK